MNFSKIMFSIDLTGKASGKAGSFPYKMVRKGTVEVEGLPRAVLPLHPPWGRKASITIVLCQHINKVCMIVIFDQKSLRNYKHLREI